MNMLLRSREVIDTVDKAIHVLGSCRRERWIVGEQSNDKGACALGWLEILCGREFAKRVNLISSEIFGMPLHRINDFETVVSYEHHPKDRVMAALNQIKGMIAEAKSPKFDFRSPPLEFAIPKFRRLEAINWGPFEPNVGPGDEEEYVGPIWKSKVMKLETV